MAPTCRGADKRPETANKKIWVSAKADCGSFQPIAPEQEHILKQHSTERPGSSVLNKEYRAGTYRCAGCGAELFQSDTKYDSGSGWPSFWAPTKARAVGVTEDRHYGMTRVELHCENCGGHLGHIFDDGPQPTSLRYCINGASLAFKPE